MLGFRYTLGCSLAIGVLALASCGKDPGPNLPGKLPDPATAPKAAKDADLIQGKWVCIEYSEDGVKVPGGGGIRAVFTAKEAKIGSDKGAMAYQYKLFGEKTPKQCDLVVPEVFTRHVAYSLQSDILTLGSHLAEDQDTPAPKSLEPAPGLSVSKFRRAEHVAAPADATKGEKPVSAEDEVALAVLRQQLSSFREHFEQKKYEELLAEMVAPDTRRKLQDSPEEKAQFLGRMKKIGDSFAKLLAALESQRPVFNTTRSRATFDVRLIHFDGLPGMPQLMFQKESDGWKMMDR